MKRLPYKIGDEIYVFMYNKNNTVSYKEYTVSRILPKTKTIFISDGVSDDMPLGYDYLDMVMKVSDCPNPAKECSNRGTFLRKTK